MAPDRIYVRRFSRTERALHWIHASAFFVLLGSGLVLYVPRFSELVGRRPAPAPFSARLAGGLGAVRRGAAPPPQVDGGRRAATMSVMATVLVVDDEPIVRDVVVRYLKRDGFDTLEAGDGDAARALIERRSPSLVVLDLMLPGMDGIALCRWIRSQGDLPVIMLTARGEEADRIVGLELGADDYVTKPFSPRELAARVRTVLRRSAPAAATVGRLSFDDLELDADTREVVANGRRLRLTAKE